MVLHPVSDALDLPPTPPSPPSSSWSKQPHPHLLCSNRGAACASTCSRLLCRNVVQRWPARLLSNMYFMKIRCVLGASVTKAEILFQNIVLLLFGLHFLYATYYHWTCLCFILITALRMSAPGHYYLTAFTDIQGQGTSVHHAGSFTVQDYMRASGQCTRFVMWCFLFSSHQRKYLMQQFGSCRGPQS